MNCRTSANKELEAKKELKRHLKHDERIHVNELIGTDNFKAMGETKDVHEYIDKHGLVKYSQKVKEDKQRNQEMQLCKPPLATQKVTDLTEGKTDELKPKRSHMKFEAFDSAVVLIKPELDASKRQILLK
mmetsp:Transcript_30157/g.34519  ORF Transcript_30157/g.34519 Transcript_30157/m.34519 type:complete len:130 (-) Transcript_30157:433-822(-)